MLTRRDYEALLDCAEVMTALERTEELGRALLSSLSRLLGAETASHISLRMSDHGFVIASREGLGEGSRAPVAVGHLLAAATIHERAGHVFVFKRKRTAFDPSDRQKLTLLRPHLEAVCERLHGPGVVQPSRPAVSTTLERREGARAEPSSNPPGAGVALERLSSREIQVLAMIAEGWANKQIARRLRVSNRTVEKHVEHVLRKLDVGSRTAAAARFLHASPAVEGASRSPARQGA